MGLINRVAISNTLNYYGDGSHKKWSPRFRFECLDFRGQSTAVNLTNGGGKSTLAEAMLAVLSRDKTLVSRTKKKFSPKSCGTWSHVQVELIRPLSNAVQADFITQQGNQVNGEHWVFGMYGFRGDQGLNYYYYKGRLEDLVIGHDNGKQRLLSSNEAFVQAKKAIQSFVMSPHEDEWEEALALKANLPQSTIRQMADFQKRGGQEKSAMLYEIKPRPGQSYAEVFFYKVLAPTIMEGVMDREGEEGEVRLEDTVERSVFSTVKAKQDAAAKRQETEELEVGVNQLAELMKVAENAEALRTEYERSLKKVQSDVQVLNELVDKGRLAGVPNASVPEGLVGEVAKHLVLEPGSTDIRVSDVGIAILLDDEAKNVNRMAERNNFLGHEVTQVIEIPCHFKLQDRQHGGRRTGKSYSIKDAKALLQAASSISLGLTIQAAAEVLEDAESWFYSKADTNPYRQRLVEHQTDLQILKDNVKELEVARERLHADQNHLLQQQKLMKTNEGLYNTLLQSGLFSDKELKNPLKTASEVRKSLETARRDMSDFDKLEAQLNEYRKTWEDYVREYGKDHAPGDTLAELEREKQRLGDTRYTVASTLEIAEQDIKKTQERGQVLQRDLDKTGQQLERLTEHSAAYGQFVDLFGRISPKGKENALRKALSKAQSRLTQLEHQQESYQEGVSALHHFHETVSESSSPRQWLEQIGARRAKIAVKLDGCVTQLNDFRAQREALDKERIAANAATRKALESLSDRSIAYQPLHQVIEVMKLPHKRRQQVLGVFSALLFAPVLASEQEAQQAAEVLAELGAQVPVFLHRSIADYCRSAEIESIEDDALLVGTTAGIISRPVACLLDPELVKREKASLDAQISEAKNHIESLKDELSSIGDETESVRLARRASKAVEDKEPEKLEAISGEIDRYRYEAETLQTQTSDANINVIRSAEVYVSLGGKEQDEALQQRLKDLTREQTTCEEQVAELVLKCTDLKGDRSMLDKQLQSVLPGELLVMLRSAITFVDKGGPDFIAHRDERHQALQHDVAFFQERHAFDKHFEGAQAYLDSLHDKDNESRLQEKLAIVSREIETTKNELTDLRCKHEALTDSIPLLRSVLESLDRAALLAIKKFRKVAQLSEDVIDSDDTDVHDDPLIQLCDELALIIHDGNPAEQTKLLANNISGNLDDIDIDRKASDLRRVRKELVGKEKAFIDEVKRVCEKAAGLKPVEIQTLKEVKFIGDIPKVRNLYEGVLEQLLKSKELLHRCESSEREARQGVASRLAYLIDYAAMDLKILQSVVGSNRGTFNSYFNVEAEVLDKAGIRRLMETVVAEVDLHEKQRRERNAEDNEEYHESLRTLVHEKLYKAIFTSPKITYVNATIRDAGDEHEFNENLSEGQKAALSLMWAIRLAEFGIERETKRHSSRRSQQKAREMSVNIMLIDGLFSNLSNRELIDSSMAGIESTRGSFQLIGLIHNPHYQNDFEKFPVFIIGKNEVNGRKGDERMGWVSFREGTPEDNTLRTAHIRCIPPPQERI